MGLNEFILDEHLDKTAQSDPHNPMMTHQSSLFTTIQLLFSLLYLDHLDEICT